MLPGRKNDCDWESSASTRKRGKMKKRRALVLLLITLVTVLYSIPMIAFGASKPTRDQVKDSKWISSSEIEVPFESNITVKDDAVSKITITHYNSDWKEVEDPLAQSVKADGKNLIITVKDEFKTLPSGIVKIKSGAIADASGEAVNDDVKIDTSGIKSGASISSAVPDSTKLTSSGGKVTLAVTGKLLTKDTNPIYKLKPSSSDSGYYSIEGNYEASDDEHASVTFDIPANTSDKDVTFTLTYQTSRYSSSQTLSENAITVAAGKSAENPDNPDNPDDPSQTTPSISGITYDAKTFDYKGGQVTAHIKGTALKSLSEGNFQIEKMGEYGYYEEVSEYRLSRTYSAASNTDATLTFTLPENTDSADQTYRLNYRLSDSEYEDWTHGEALTVSANPDKALQITKINAPASNLTSVGGSVTFVLEGSNLTTLTRTDIKVESKSFNGYMDDYDVKVKVEASHENKAEVTVTFPANTGKTEKNYRVTFTKAGSSVANRVVTYAVPESTSDAGTFTLEVDDISAYKMDDDSYEVVFPRFDQIEINPEVKDARNLIVFGNGSDHSNDYTLGEKDTVSVIGNTLKIHIADSSMLRYPQNITLKSGLLKKSDGKILGADTSSYIHEGAHADSISFSKTILTSSGGKVSALLKGKNLNQSSPKLAIKVFSDNGKDASSTIQPVVTVNSEGTEAQIEVTLPENKTTSPVTYRLIPYLNGSSVYKQYLKGYDVITVLGEGQKDDGSSLLASVEISGGNDVDNRPEVYETNVTSSDYTVKIDAVLRGTNLSSKKTKVKVVDENGVEWPVAPVFECGATVRWQSSALYLPEDASNNEQSIELLPPRHIGADRTYKLYFAVDGEHFADSPTATVIIHNDGVWSSEDGFTQDQLNKLQDITVKYVDEQGNELHTPKTVKGYGITELYTLGADPLTIDGYKLKSCNVNQHWFEAPVLGDDGTYHFKYGQHFVKELEGKDNTIVYTYTKNSSVTPSTPSTPSTPAKEDVQKEKSDLQDSINKAASVDTSKYTNKSAEAFKKAYEEAQKVFNDANATKDDLTIASAKLNHAVNALTSALKIGKTTLTAKAAKRAAVLKWKKLKGVTGYKIYMATKKNGKYKLVKVVKKPSQKALTLKKMKSGHKYYFKMKGYKKVDGQSFNGSYSNIAAAKIK